MSDGLHIYSLNPVEEIVSTNLFVVRQGGETGEDKKATALDVRNFILKDDTLLNVEAPQIQVFGNLNINDTLTINGIDLSTFVKRDHDHDDLYYRKDYINNILDNKAALNHHHNNLYYEQSALYNRTETDDLIESTISGLADSIADQHDHNNLYYTEAETNSLLNNIDYRLGGTMNGSLTVAGNLTVNGTTTTLNTQELVVEDSVIVVNSNLEGSPPDSLVSGVEVNRGSLTNYQFIFAENSDTFRLGEIGNTQPVATREDNPTFDGFARWDAINNRFVTYSTDNVIQLIYDEFEINPSYTYIHAKIANTDEVGAVKYNGNTKQAGTFYGGSTNPTESTFLNYDGYFKATRVYNAVWNDFADFQKVSDKVIYGKVYYHNGNDLSVCNRRCQKSVVGIASDTHGQAVGHVDGENQAPIAVAGWVLACVDKEYESGTALINNKNGDLTKASISEKILFPERIVAIFQSKEKSQEWNGVKVNNRMWVKIK